ncbi:MAG TPA: hypothetical protein VGA16_06535 [Candidatus Limnocylindria bacterium]
MPSELRAALIGVLLVVFAATIGIAVGTRARSTPTPRPVPSATTIALPSATAADPADVQRRAFAQPLAAGCATDKAVWLFADGGSAIRFDGRVWTIPDPTLRSLTAAACRGGSALAVGAGGSLLTADDDHRELRVDRTGNDDLHGISLFIDGALAVGEAGTVLQQTVLEWRPVATGATEDLRGVSVAFERVVTPGRSQAWVVGASGASYRLTEAGWQRVPTGTTETLRAIVQQGDVALAAGDRGTILRSEKDAWTALASGTDVDLRAAAIVGATTAWIVGDKGTVIEVSGAAMRRVEIGTTCTLRAVFAQDASIWVVGSDGVRGGAWRIRPTGTDRWGTC